MIRENVKKNMDIISAFAEGKVIQILNERDKWVDLTEREGLPMGTLEETPDIFRIKPELKYRPFKDAEECWQEMLKHQPFGWIKGKEGEHHSLITSIIADEEEVYINGISGFVLDEIMEHYTFADGQPFGINVEE